jgi:(p)ppGpp synthase/HD superfamily hydrolase
MKTSEKEPSALVSERSPVETTSAFINAIQKKFDKRQRARILHALAVSMDVHKYQKRKDGSPYYVHPIEVAMKTSKLLNTPYESPVIAALLHDVPEDQPHRYLLAHNVQIDDNRMLAPQAIDVIDSIYGPDVAHIVNALTIPDFVSDDVHEKNMGYLEHVQDAIEDPIVCLVKFADFSINGAALHNLKDIPLRVRLTHKYRPVVDIFLARLDNPDLERLPTDRLAEMQSVLHESALKMDEFLRTLVRGNSKKAYVE